jgi:hypothetical protein
MNILNQFIQRLCLSVLCAVSLYSLPAQAEPVVNPATGIELPDEIGKFQRVSVIDHESQQAGLGYSYEYKASAGWRASVYIYTAGLPAVPQSIEEPAGRTLRDQSIREMEQFASSRGQRLTHELSLKVTEHTEAGEIPFFLDGFIVRVQEAPWNTYLVLWCARGHFIKIRMTRYLYGDVDISPKSFYETILKLSVQKPSP